MSALVVDASVVIKWFVPETASEAACLLLRTPHDYFAPDLLFAEIAGIVGRKVRRQELTVRDGARLLDDIGRCALVSVPCRALLPDAQPIAAATGQSIADAMYLALAVRLKTKLITADEPLWKSVSAFAILARHIELLGRPPGQEIS
jgi:predicted nucleic acid-binding protein